MHCLLPLFHNLAAVAASPPLRLPICAPPTGLGEYFFFISLVVGLPCSLIFCQFWLFFVFKLLLTFWLCQEVQCVYLRLHLGFSLIFYISFAVIRIATFLHFLINKCCALIPLNFMKYSSIFIFVTLCPEIVCLVFGQRSDLFGINY